MSARLQGLPWSLSGGRPPGGVFIRLVLSWSITIGERGAPPPTQAAAPPPGRPHPRHAAFYLPPVGHARHQAASGVTALCTAAEPGSEVIDPQAPPRVDHFTPHFLSASSAISCPRPLLNHKTDSQLKAALLHVCHEVGLKGPQPSRLGHPEAPSQPQSPQRAQMRMRVLTFLK